MVCKWFDDQSTNTYRSKCAHVGNLSSDFVQFTKCVPCGEIIGPILFSIFTHNITLVLPDSNIHWYAVFVFCTVQQVVGILTYTEIC